MACVNALLKFGHGRAHSELWNKSFLTKFKDKYDFVYISSHNSCDVEESFSILVHKALEAELAAKLWLEYKTGNIPS